jgi:hypothetical protein
MKYVEENVKKILTRFNFLNLCVFFLHPFMTLGIQIDIEQAKS